MYKISYLKPKKKRVKLPTVLLNLVMTACMISPVSESVYVANSTAIAYLNLSMIHMLSGSNMI